MVEAPDPISTRGESGMTPTLETERLVLKPYEVEDADAFVELFADEAVARWMGDGPESRDENRAIFGRIFSDVYPHDRFDVWAVWEGDRFVGHAEVKDTTDIEGHEIIYALSRDVWHRGLGSELARALASYCFDVLGLDEVHATVDARNLASLAVLEKVGFVRVREIADDDGSTTVVLTYRREAGRQSR
jgi:RimJ/RimL family protein N-acetyltransferase